MANQLRDAARWRPLLKKAIFGGTGGADPEIPQACERVATGTVLDASPHILVIATETGVEERFALTGKHVGLARRIGATRIAHPGLPGRAAASWAAPRRGPDLG